MVRLATLDPCVGPFAQIDRRRHAGELFALTRQIILQLDGSFAAGEAAGSLIRAATATP
ncbi:hypothetical protein [Rhizobium ruizarguesonis]|uniref:hypothetical protein n=1 Tax=Rhizobium ruizarguesonis TaxID=2081791 RepID=UPI0013EEA8E7